MKKFHQKKMLFLGSLVFLLLAGVFSFAIFRRQKVSTTQNDKMAWKSFVSQGVGISFKYPDTYSVRIEDLSGIITVNPDKQLTYESTMSSAESRKPSDTLNLNIRAYKTFEEAKSDGGYAEYVSLTKNSKVQELFRTSQYIYKLVYAPDVPTFSYKAVLAQCKFDNTCTRIINRELNSSYPFVFIYVTTAEGWRYGGAPIIINSPKYKVMQSVVESIRF